MQYKNTTKIIIDKRKLDLLVRLSCPSKQILEVITTGKFTPTGDILIDETLECLCDFKDFSNWGGKRDNSGRKQKNQVENQIDYHLENQDGGQDVDKDKDKDKDKDRDKENKNINIAKPVDKFAGRKVIVEDGKFYIDDTMAEYKDLLKGMNQKDVENCWAWIYDNFYGKQVDVCWVRNMIKRFKGNWEGTV